MGEFFLKRKRTIQQYAQRLQKQMPKSEVWFWELYEKNGLKLKSDQSNQILGNYIFDVLNGDLRYVIEIQDPGHKRSSRKRRDQLKREYAQSRGFHYIAIKGWSLTSFFKGMESLKEYCG